MKDSNGIPGPDSSQETEAALKLNGSARKKILLVEDQKVTSKVEAYALEKMEYEVTIVISGEKAVEAIKTDPSIDLVLMDIELGEGIDGTEAARQILAVRNLPLIFLTAHSGQEMVEKVRGITRYGYVIKNSGDFVLRSSIEMTFELFDAHANLERKKEELRILSSHLQKVREEERTLIAREIHDELGQTLTSLKMDLTWLRGKLPEEQKYLHSRTYLMLKDLSSAIDTVHRIFTGLRPFILDDFGITAAIIGHTGNWQALTGISCALSLSSEEIPLPCEVATALFRICQEALTNVARHSGATEVKVSLVEKESSIVLTIEDNGRGITEQQSKGPAALGIMGMKEHAYALGGEVNIHGAQGKGTTLEATFPLEKRK
ncbi:MAG: response regulator [Candidatus Eremiobacteraeota bacterium]|nr:response regulator [Candidatus Eremiobacteraeota bacterium]